MKKNKFLLILIITISFACCKKNTVDKVKQSHLQKANERESEIGNKSSKMSFKNTTYDFGNIKQGDVVETFFKFTNTGNLDLIISNATSSCGCTIPEWPKQPIKPGQQSSIKVVFNSRGKLNKQQKVVTLTTNTISGNEKVLIIAHVYPKLN